MGDSGKKSFVSQPLDRPTPVGLQLVFDKLEYAAALVGLAIRVTDQTAKSAGDQLNSLVSPPFRIGFVKRFGDRTSKDLLVEKLQDLFCLGLISREDDLAL